MTNSWMFGGDSKLHGYSTRRDVEYSLTERLNLALMSRSKQLRNILALNSDSYGIDTPAALMRFVAFLDKPIANLLDEIGIPRTYSKTDFHELAGPTRYINPRFSVRRIVPGTIPANELVVQPMVRFTAELPIMAMNWDKINEIVNGISPSLEKAK